MAITNYMVNKNLGENPISLDSAEKFPALNQSKINSPSELDRNFDLSSLFLQEELNHEKTKEPGLSTFKEFLTKPLVTFTTTLSAGLNIISAPTRLFNDDNPLKQLINKISMFSTKVHLLAYSAAGLVAAHDQKNPLYIFSNIIEGLAAVLGLRNIYLFRGIGTGVDGMVIGIKDKDKKINYNSYLEGWTHSIGVIKNVFKEFFHKLTTDPLSLRKIKGNDL